MNIKGMKNSKNFVSPFAHQNFPSVTTSPKKKRVTLSKQKKKVKIT
jgi:hypothetical protein